MAIRRVTAEDGLKLKRGSAVVCIPAVPVDPRVAGEQHALATIESVVEHTDASIAVLVAGTASVIERIESALALHLRDKAILGLVLESEANQTEAINAAARASSPSDLVLVAPGIGVTTNWFERLRGAARSDSTVASATPFSLGGGALELLPDEESARVESPAGVEIAGPSQIGSLRIEGSIGELADRVAERSLRLRPRIATVGPGCAYICRAALELTGPLDESLPVGRALAEQAMQAIAVGLVHVAADDVLVEGARTGRAGPDAWGSLSSFDTEGRVQETLANDERGSFHRALGVARTALRGLSVTIDGRAMTSAVGGTQTYIIELILALARERKVALRVLVPPDLSKRAAEALATVPDLELLSYERAVDRPSRSDVVHRPQSVFTADDLTLLRLLGERVVIGQLDLIAYHNYSYHRDVDHWRAYRRATRLALGGADQVIFFSEHARRDALAEDLLPEGRTHVVGVGAEVLELTGSPETRPHGVTEADPFLLCLGADYAHKNRSFAIELLGALHELGWMGRLVLAGAHVPCGSSREREQQLLRSRPDLARLVVDLGPVDEAAKNWLYWHARALVYPTVYEGFGLLPSEAARADLPCLFASQASLSEVAGQAATLVPWDARASAAAVLPLLTDGPHRDEHLASLHALGIPAWGEVAERVVAVYELAVAAPPPEAAPRAWQELDRESFIGTLETTAQEYQDAYHALEARVVSGLPLIDNGGLLSPSQQRGLMRVAARRRLGAVMLGPFGLLGRAAATGGATEPPDASPD